MTFFEILIEEWQITPLKPMILLGLPLMVFLGVYLIFYFMQKPLPTFFYYLTGIVIPLNFIYGSIFECACVDKYPYENTLKMGIGMTVFSFAFLLGSYFIGKKLIKIFKTVKN